MHNEVKKHADDKDIRWLQYGFADCLDVDPTFEEYEEDFQYCCKNVPEIFERHVDLTTHIDNNQRNWTNDYWNGLKVDLLKNFSRERFEHMQKVARIVYADKIFRLEQERKQELEMEHRRRELEQENKRFEEDIRKNCNVQSEGNLYNSSKDQSNRNTEVQLNINKTSKQQKQELELKRARRELEQENKRFEEEIQKRNVQSQPCNTTRSVQGEGGAKGKKVLGAVLIIVALSIIILILISVVQN